MNLNSGELDLKSLAQHGVQQPLIEAWEADGLTTLTACQRQAFAHAPLWEGRNTLVVAPTSSGKTFIGEVMAAKSAYTLDRAIFLVPFKALAEEKFSEFQARYREIGLPVVISDGDHTEFDHQIRSGDFGIAIIVYEKMIRLLIQSPGILAHCAVVVIDEVQLISDSTRGPSLELLLAYLRQATSKPQLIALSATVADVGGLDDWLDADRISCSARPVPLWEAVATPAGVSDFLNVEKGISKGGTQFTNVVGRRADDRADAKFETLLHIIQSETLKKQFLIFRTRVDDTISTARKLAQNLPTDPVEPEIREELSGLESTRLSEFLDRWLDKRVAYHNAGLALEERRLVEGLFRRGIVRILVTTSTLSAGINTAADVVIVMDNKRWNWSQRSNVHIPVAEYRNSAGRAGRLGMSQEGHSYLIAATTQEEQILIDHFVLGNVASLESSIAGAADLSGVVLRLMALIGVPLSSNELVSLLDGSFAARAWEGDSKRRDSYTHGVMRVLADLRELNLVEADGLLLRVSDLGRVVAASETSVDTFQALMKVIELVREEGADSEGIWPRLAAMEDLNRFRPYDQIGRSQVLADWVGGVAVRTIIETYSERYELGHGHVRGIGQGAAWLLGTAAELARAWPDGEDIEEVSDEVAQTLDELSQRSRYGCLSEALKILLLGYFRRDEANRLALHGYADILDSPHKLLDVKADDLSGVIWPARLREVQDSILASVGDSLKVRRFEHISRASKFYGLDAIVRQCYDARGRGFEKVLEQLLHFEGLSIDVHRYGSQDKGQPDLELAGRSGTIVIQATASDDGLKPVSWNKAKTVLGSVGYSGAASNFVVVAIPGFHEIAVGNARELADRGDQRLLLLPLAELIELVLIQLEGEEGETSLLRVLEDDRGHFDSAQR